MRYHRRLKTLTEPIDHDLDAILTAMSSEELRDFIRDTLNRLDVETRAALLDQLTSKAARGKTGWKPAGPPPALVDEIQSYIEARRRAGYADPREFDDYLRQGTKAFLADDHSSTRAIFKALLAPVADAEVDLGQHEMVDEVLTIDIYACAAQYLVAVYTTTSLDERAEALWEAIETIRGVSTPLEPLREMERAATGPLPELDSFLPLWMARIEREPTAQNDWESNRDRWLREAALRFEGVSGLARIARQSRRPESLRAWCSTLADRAQWSEALRAYQESAKIVEKGSFWQGDFLDGAALSAREPGRRDVTTRLEAAWRGAPSLVRLVRWLGTDCPKAATLSKRVANATKTCPATAGRQLGLLRILAGDFTDAADLLAKAPGLGWSSDDHPGHLLFPAFSGILAKGMKAKLNERLYDTLRVRSQEVYGPNSDWEDIPGEKQKPKLVTPTVAELVGLSALKKPVDTKSRKAMLDAMSITAEKRIEGVTGHQRRRHYGHAAMLAVCCFELGSIAGTEPTISKWFTKLRQQYSRYPAFRKYLDEILAQIDVRK